jgi:hypothetical protein
MTHAGKWRISLVVIACLLLNAACAHTPSQDADHAGQEDLSPEELEAELKKVQEEVRNPPVNNSLLFQPSFKQWPAITYEFITHATLKVYCACIHMIPCISVQVEKLRKEHNEVFTAGDTDKDGFMSSTEFFAVSFQFQVVQ